MQKMSGSGPAGDFQVRTPAPGSWPCQTQTDGDVPARLKCALYLLLRDHVQPGDLEQVAINSTYASDVEVTYTNPHLEAYATALAEHLSKPATEVS